MHNWVKQFLSSSSFRTKRLTWKLCKLQQTTNITTKLSLSYFQQFSNIFYWRPYRKGVSLIFLYPKAQRFAENIQQEKKSSKPDLSTRPSCLGGSAKGELLFSSVEQVKLIHVHWLRPSSKMHHFFFGSIEVWWYIWICMRQISQKIIWSTFYILVLFSLKYPILELFLVKNHPIMEIWKFSQ